MSSYPISKIHRIVRRLPAPLACENDRAEKPAAKPQRAVLARFAPLVDASWRSAAAAESAAMHGPAPPTPRGAASRLCAA